MPFPEIFSTPLHSEIWKFKWDRSHALHVRLIYPIVLDLIIHIHIIKNGIYNAKILNGVAI